MKRQTKHSAGYDIAVTTGGWILPFMTKRFETKASFNIEEDEAVLLLPRSSVGIKRKLRLSNSVALIDSDYYPNDCMIELHNFGFKPRKIEAGERVAQALVIKYQTLKGENKPTQERTGGIGSTGKTFEEILNEVDEFPKKIADLEDLRKEVSSSFYDATKGMK